ncbi:MAG: hypothetical protein H0U03_05255 [Actinobacteria bacterium]|nr:hypothetical protein [Actinomycetota bacterium]
METILGLIGLVAFMVAVISVAAGITWSVVKLTPGRSKENAAPPAGEQT